MSGVCKTKGKETACKHCTLVDKVVPMRTLVNNFDSAMVQTGIEQMDNMWWKAGFLLLEWKFTGKQGEESRMIQYSNRVGGISVNSCLPKYRHRGLHIEIFIDIYIHTWFSIHTYFLALSAERV